MNPSPTRLPTLLDKLKRRGFRITPQRVAILKAAIEDEGHPTVEQVYQAVRLQYPMTSLATVYKTLALMKSENEAFDLGLGGAARIDAFRPYPHPHLICINCQRIVDLDATSQPSVPPEVSREHGFKDITARVDYYGICPACQAQESDVYQG